MLSLRRPSTSAIRGFLARQSKLDFTYSGIGCTATVPPAGYTVDHTRVGAGNRGEGLPPGQGRVRAMGSLPPGLGRGVAAGNADPARRGHLGARASSSAPGA